MRRPLSMVVMLVGVLTLAPWASAGDSTETVTKGSTESFVEKIGEGKGLPAGYDAAQTKYFLHKPDNYDGKKAWPLILGISPGPAGNGIFASWTTAAQKYGFFFACPDEAGNEVEIDVRGQRVVDTLFDVRAKYNIDPEQIYVTGFSGGGRVSTGMVSAFPGLFAGHIPIGGIRIGQDPKLITSLKTKLGIYLFAGEKCFNRPESEQEFASLKAANVPCELMIGPGLDHTIPTAEMGLKIYEWFLARQALVSAPVLAAKLTAAEKLEKAGNLGAALAAYEALAGAGIDHDAVVRAKEKAVALAADGRQRLDAARALPGPDALAALDKLIAFWDGTELAKEATAARQTIAESPDTQREVEARRTAARERDAKAALDQAAALAQAGKLPEAQDAYAAAAKEFADTPSGAAAGAEATRLAADPRTAILRQEADARRMMQKVDNLLKNKMTAKAKTMLEEIAKTWPETETGKKAKKMAAEIK